MTATAIIQARMSSSRLPGKVLAPLGKEPALSCLVERLSRCKTLNDLIIATSDHASDEPIAELAQKLGVQCYRGPLNDVALRYIQITETFGLSSFVRICGDSPLLDPAIVDYAVSLFEAGPCDITTNVHPRSFPKGQSVEVVDSAAFKAAYSAMREASDREHVTSWFYTHEQQVAITNFTYGQDASEIRLCIDTLDDLMAMQSLVARMTKYPHQYSLNELLALLSNLPSH